MLKPRLRSHSFDSPQHQHQQTRSVVPSVNPSTPTVPVWPSVPTSSSTSLSTSRHQEPTTFSRAVANNARPEAAESSKGVVTNPKPTSSSSSFKKLSALAPAFVPSFMSQPAMENEIHVEAVEGLADSIALMKIEGRSHADLGLDDSGFESQQEYDGRRDDDDDDMESVASSNDSVEILIPNEASCLPLFLTHGERKGQNARSHSESPAPRMGRVEGSLSFDDASFSSKTRPHCPRSLSLSGDHPRGRLMSSPDPIIPSPAKGPSLLSFPSLAPTSLPFASLTPVSHHSISYSRSDLSLKTRGKKSIHQRSITATKLRISPTRTLGRRSHSHYARPSARSSQSPRRDLLAGGFFAASTTWAAALTDYDLPPNPRIRSRGSLMRSSSLKEPQTYAYHLRATGSCTSPLAGLLLTTTTSGNGGGMLSGPGVAASYLTDADGFLDGRAISQMSISGQHLRWPQERIQAFSTKSIRSNYFEGTALAAERPV
ncbi:hypothetical protein HDU67_002873 [Dinochytrium kinnereticum]|nr:hypothetical protein HDU67_002873 [Dinochytrium kinnereticum]